MPTGPETSSAPTVQASARLRGLIAAALGIAWGIFAFAAAAGIVGLGPAAAALGAIAGGLAARRWWKHPPLEVDAAACSRGLKILAAVVTLAALVQIGRLTVFMVSPDRTGCSSVPSSEWERRHSCLSAYFVAAQAAKGTSSIYDPALYSAPDDNPAALRKPQLLGPFRIDVYEYPPPFLTLPRALLLVVPDFMRFRMLWFGLTGAVVLLGIVAAARRLGPAAGTRALLLSPLIWVALPTLSALQKGNLQVVVIAMSVLAMDLFERQRWASGGALLAFSTVSKLFPGLLAIYLLAQRQWRALAWTAAMGIGFILLALLDIGWAPFAAFLDHLPGLVGGEAFPAFRNPAAMAVNVSVPGIVFKLKIFGVSGMSFGAAKLVGWIYTVFAVWAAYVLGRRALRDGERPLAWLAVLVLATLRSPFLPQSYAAFPPLWLLTLIAATLVPTAKTLVWTLAAWTMLNVFWPLDWPMDPRALALLNAVPQAVTIGLAALVVRRAIVGRPDMTGAPEGARATVAAA